MNQKLKRKSKFSKQLENLDLTDNQINVILNLLEKAYISGKNSQRIKIWKDNETKQMLSNFKESNNIPFYD